MQDQLAARGFQTFLPEVEVWARLEGRRRVSRVPMFPGYLFLRHAMDKDSYVEVLKARGLVRVLGERWDRLSIIPDSEVEAIRKVLDAHLCPVPYPYLSEGQRVRVRQGPLAGVEGILLGVDSRRGHLILSVEIFRRSMSVDIDCTMVAAA